MGHNTKVCSSKWKKIWERCRSLAGKQNPNYKSLRNGKLWSTTTTTTNIDHCNDDSNSSSSSSSVWTDDHHAAKQVAITTHKEKRSRNSRKPKVAPVGCFSVYVGPEKQRFVIRTEIVNHPLFLMLLEEAELEYGYRSDGPILLPCEVDFFNKVLAEIDSEEEEDEDDEDHQFFAFPCCSRIRFLTSCRNKVAYRHSDNYKLLSPYRMIIN